MIRSKRVYKKKICVLGASAVGKTSLVRRFVRGEYGFEYCPSIGASIDKVLLQVDGDRLQLMLWDIQGESRSSRRYTEYIKGASAIVYVVDGTRLDTLETALEFRRQIHRSLARPPPSIVLFNKADLSKTWEISTSMINDVEKHGIFALLTSAREGSGVDTAFNLLARVLLGKVTMIAA